MKPQLVSLDSGHHNQDLVQSSQRILQGNSWKKQRVIMLIPAGAEIPTKVYLSHCGLVFPPNQAAHRMAQARAHGLDGDVERLGDLSLCLSEVVVEDHHRTMVEGQPAEFRAELARVPHGGGRKLGRNGRPGRLDDRALGT